MRKSLFDKLTVSGSIVALAVIGSTSVFALPAQAGVHAQTTSTGSSTNMTMSSTTNSQSSSMQNMGTSGKMNGQMHLAAAQLKVCQNRENSIKNIMTRIDTRAQNQLTLFSTIAARVETFYSTKSKTVANYSQLVAAVTSTKAQATTDLSSVKSSSSFSCTASDPKGMVNSFQSYLKMEISDLQNYRMAVKNLIVGVASANGVTVSSTSHTSTTAGGQ